jgi:hypothetical protein
MANGVGRIEPEKKEQGESVEIPGREAGVRGE